MKATYVLGAAALAVLACNGSALAAPVAQEAATAAADLRAAVTNGRVRAFYEAHGWRPVWTEARARELGRILDGAMAHGLAHGRFLPAKAARATGVAREVALTRAALGYADALARGVVDPKELRETFTLQRADADVAVGLAGALDEGSLAAWFDGLAPRSDEYRALSAAYRGTVRSGGERRDVPAGDPIGEGDAGARVPLVRAALDDRGYPDASAGDGDRYGAALAAAVRRFQRDHGLRVDGVVGPDTLALLNQGAADRARRLAVNMERLRWLDRDPPPTRVDVDTGAAELVYRRDGAIADRRPVIVGRPDWETPQLGSPIFRLVANPNWTVPKSIEEAELAGKSAAYLKARNMVRRDGWIVQLPGPDNALGQVKFDMRNRYAIYLHDTPAKGLFDRADRHLSHGCVRVEDALGFARALAEQEGMLARFEEAMATGEETYVDLPREIPVRLFYRTAQVGADGGVRLIADAYGWDADLAEAMGLGAVAKRAQSEKIDDLGP